MQRRKYVKSYETPECPVNSAITWPQGVYAEEDSLAVAAQVHGDVREWQERQVLELVTITQSLSLLHPRKLVRRS